LWFFLRKIRGYGLLEVKKYFSPFNRADKFSKKRSTTPLWSRLLRDRGQKNQSVILKGKGDALSARFFSLASSALRISSSIKASIGAKNKVCPSSPWILTPVSLTLMVNFTFFSFIKPYFHYSRTLFFYVRFKQRTAHLFNFFKVFGSQIHNIKNQLKVNITIRPQSFSLLDREKAL